MSVLTKAVYELQDKGKDILKQINHNQLKTSRRNATIKIKIYI